LFLVLAMALSAYSVTIPNGTVVVVKTQSELKSSKLTMGQELIFIVGAPVKIKGKTVIEAGAAVVGIVQDAKGKQMAGIPGKFSVAIQNTTAVDGSTIQLTGNFMAGGDSEVGATVAVGVILCPLALLNQGEDGVVPAGAQTRAMTVGEYEIEVE
jgi:hypothetical protein